jgi:hypothetical protein
MRHEFPIRLLLSTSLVTATLTNFGTIIEGQVVPEKSDLKPLAQLVKPERQWSPTDFNSFLSALPAEARLSLMKALKMVSDDSTRAALKDTPTDVREIKKRILWLSNHLVKYPFLNEEKIDYHSLVLWVAETMEVDARIRNTQPTLIVERAIIERIFVKAWDKLSPEQRLSLLTKIDTDRKLDKVAIAAGSGSTALAILSTTVYFSGFAFYTTMGTTICTVAGFFGITVPFAGYAGASSTVALLSGPVGWVLVAIGAVVCVGIAGRANVIETLRAITEIHSLKIQALVAAGEECPEVPRFIEQSNQKMKNDNHNQTWGEWLWEWFDFFNIFGF